MTSSRAKMPGGVVFGQRDAHSVSFGSRSSLTAAVCAEVTLLVGALGAGSPVSGALAAIAAFAAAAAARSGRCCGAASTVLVAIGREAGGRAATASRLLAGFWSGNSGVDDDDELNINTPTPCQIGKRPPAAPKPKRESAGHQGVAGGGYLWSHAALSCRGGFVGDLAGARWSAPCHGMGNCELSEHKQALLLWLEERGLLACRIN